MDLNHNRIVHGVTEIGRTNSKEAPIIKDNQAETTAVTIDRVHILKLHHLQVLHHDNTLAGMVDIDEPTIR